LRLIACRLLLCQVNSVCFSHRGFARGAWAGVGSPPCGLPGGWALLLEGCPFLRGPALRSQGLRWLVGGRVGMVEAGGCKRWRRRRGLGFHNGLGGK